LGVYRVQETTKEEFVANAVQVEMQHRHFYIARHTTSAIVIYRSKHKIVDIDMV
jgi:hypothetical protein